MLVQGESLSLEENLLLIPDAKLINSENRVEYFRLWPQTESVFQKLTSNAQTSVKEIGEKHERNQKHNRETQELLKRFNDVSLPDNL